MIEAALVFSRKGRTLWWHLPQGRSQVYIPDSRTLWETMWENRKNLGGVAHSHPTQGTIFASLTDLTTWSACERALGQHLIWPIVTFSEMGYFVWDGPNDLDYQRIDTIDYEIGGLEELRRLSREEKER